MNTAPRRISPSTGPGQRNELVRGERRGNPQPTEEVPRVRVNGVVETRARVYIAAENRLLREALSRMLTRQGAMHAVQAGEAVCPGSLCALLFRFFEREATSVHSATIHPRLGLTRREQQIVPLIAQGLTNKEIANQFCLSEQPVKNHLYRMKHKVGAGDRFGIVHLCRTQGFLV